MPLEMGTQGQPDFSQPVELMMDCHRRIERFLEVLQRVVDRYRDVRLDDEGRHALATALNYFKQAAPRHTADEEQSLFPRMRASGDPAVAAALEQIDRLEADHRRVEQAHAQLEGVGRRWLDRGRLETDEVDSLAALLAEMAQAYAQHIHTEDHEVFVLAGRVLSAQELQAVGQEMKARRIEDPGREGSRCGERRRQMAEQQAGETTNEP